MATNATNTNYKKTVVLGASANPERYSNIAVRKLVADGHEVVAIGNAAATIGNTPIINQQPPINNVNTVTLYLNPSNQQPYYDYIVSLHPKRLIFNPGTENPELEQLAKLHQIATINACTLVLLSTHQY